MRPDRHQRDWNDFFAREDRQREARRKLIDDLPIDAPPRVAAGIRRLIAVIDWLADETPGSKYLPDGTRQVSVKMDVICWRLDLTINPVRLWIDRAAQTPYFKVSAANHRPHIFCICWPAIVNGGDGGNDVEGITATGSSRGSVRSTEEGVSLQNRGGESDPLPNPVLRPVFCISEKSKKPVSKPGFSEADPLRQMTGDEWRVWRKAIIRRRLDVPEDVEQLFREAVRLQIVRDSEQDRLEVFTQAVRDQRHAAVPGALFRENVAFRRWWADGDDEDQARQMMRLLEDRREPNEDEIAAAFDAWLRSETRQRQLMKAT